MNVNHHQLNYNIMTLKKKKKEKKGFTQNKDSIVLLSKYDFSLMRKVDLMIYERLIEENEIKYCNQDPKHIK